MHAVIDVDAQTTPIDELSGRIGLWMSAKQEPAIDSVRAAKADFSLDGRTRSRNGWPAGEQSGQVVGVNGRLPPASVGAVNREAGKVAPVPAEKVHLPVRPHCPDESGKRIDDAAQLAFHGGSR